MGTSNQQVGKRRARKRIPIRRVAGSSSLADFVQDPFPPMSISHSPSRHRDMNMPELRVLLDGLAYVESPRWHDGRLWFAHWGTGEVVAVDMEGRSEVVAQGPPGLGWSIDWLPDGCLLVTGPELLRQEPDGSMVPHADLRTVADHRWNEIVVDGRGNIYVNGFGFDFLGGEDPRPASSRLSRPTGLHVPSPTRSSFPTEWLSRPTTARSLFPSRWRAD